MKTCDNQINSPPLWKQRRYFVVLMAFLGLFNIFALRMILSVGIVAMTEKKQSAGEVHHFDWDSKEKGIVLSAFFWGYMATQIVGGILAQRYGGHLPFGVAVGASSVLNLLTPCVAKLSIHALTILKALDGAFQGLTFACIYDMFAKWAPPANRAKMVTISSAGIQIGTVVSLAVSGVLAAKVCWESIFYTFGGFGCVWTVSWMIFVRSSPAEDRFISREERHFIEKSLETETKNPIKKTPWKSILKSSAVWAIAVAQFVEGWGFVTLHTQLPQFLNDALDYNIAESGLVSSLPYLSMALMLQIAGFSADYIQSKGFLSKRNTRRIFTCGAFMGQAVLRLCVVYFLHPIISIVLITISVSLASFSFAGFSVNYLEIAPQFSGIIMALCNFISCFAGILSPMLTGFIVTTPNNQEWRIVFIISGVIYIVGSLIYWTFCDANVQPWAIESSTEESKEKLVAKVPEDFRK